MKKYFSISIVFYLLFGYVIGQDLHFSQYNQSPLNLNPSLTGNFNSNIRLIGNYRNQWNSVGEPYSTFSFSAEARNLFGPKKLSYGIVAYTDNAGVGDLRKNNYGISINFSQTLNYDSTLSLSIGSMLAYQQYTIDYAQFSFDKQYNGYRFDNRLANGETFSEDSYGYFNPAIGTHLNYIINQNNAIKFGVAFHNILKPQNSFFNASNELLKNRTTYHLSSNFLINQMSDIQPSIMFMQQGKFKELVFGSNYRIYLERTKYSKKALVAGLYYRNKDAAFFNLGYENSKTIVGFSYDINTSELNTASNNKGGFELSVVYLISNYKPLYKRGTRCPNFM